MRSKRAERRNGASPRHAENRCIVKCLVSESRTLNPLNLLTESPDFACEESQDMSRFRVVSAPWANLRRILHADCHRIAALAGVDPHQGDQAEREVAERRPCASDRPPSDDTDRLQDLVNAHAKIQQMLGHSSLDESEYELQNIRDIVKLRRLVARTDAKLSEKKAWRGVGRALCLARSGDERPPFRQTSLPRKAVREPDQAARAAGADDSARRESVFAKTSLCASQTSGPIPHGELFRM